MPPGLGGSILADLRRMDGFICEARVEPALPPPFVDLGYMGRSMSGGKAQYEHSETDASKGPSLDRDLLRLPRCRRTNERAYSRARHPFR
jgi:hypothetical protein